MSAEDLGRRLLGEVKEESLSELLSSLRTLRDPQPSSQLNIPALDQLLSIFQAPVPITQIEAPAPWSSPQHSSHRPVITKKHALKSAVIEITGRSSCSGKTQLLYYITALSVLPAVFQGHALYGKEGAVIVLDTDGRFDVSRLRQVMWHYVRQQQGTRYQSANPSSDVDVDALLTAALHHIHIFRPQSSASLLATIETLPNYLLSATTHISQNRCLQTLLLDSASAFFWQDRMADDQLEALAANEGTNKGSETKAFVQTWQALVRALRYVQSTFGCTIIATNWGLFTNTPPQQQQYTSQVTIPSIRPHLPPVWTSFCTLRIVVQREKVRQFVPEMSFMEAVAENDRRLEAVRQAGFSGWVDGWDSEGWSTEIRQRLRTVQGRGSFWFWVRDEGVGIEEWHGS
ncbi:MAG: hypothetical protein M1812_006967 [Candelaria pacifica]|nr:MAG: hypothetical protein M1812_006967 [Candelaria pacifica]